MKIATLMQRNSKRAAAGFSLVETAIALLILGLLALAITAYWQSATQAKVKVAERDLLTRAQGAVVGFAFTKGRLPCPAAVGGTGLESCTLGQVGELPWATLGLADAGAKQMKYGAYKKANATASLDNDLTAAKDRFRHLLPVGSPPIAVPSLIGNNNGYDFCSALSVLGRAETQPAGDATYLSTASPDGTTNVRNIAFALAMPGLLDADGDGNRFDGLQASQTAASPVFDGPTRIQTSVYDDKVVAVSATALFANLSCGLGFSAADHTHFNALNAARIIQKGMVDYAFLMTLNAKLAAAAIASGASGVASATSGVALAAAEIASTTADTIFTFGALAPAIALSIVAMAAAVAALALAVAAIVSSVIIKAESDQIVTDFGPYVTESRTLANSIEVNARAADAAGL